MLTPANPRCWFVEVLSHLALTLSKPLCWLLGSLYMTTQTNPFSHKLITQPLRDSTEPSSLIWNPSNSWDNPPYVGEPTTLVPVCSHQLPQLLTSVVSFALTGCSDFTTFLFRWHLPCLYESHIPRSWLEIKAAQLLEKANVEPGGEFFKQTSCLLQSLFLVVIHCVIAHLC